MKIMHDVRHGIKNVRILPPNHPRTDMWKSLSTTGGESEGGLLRARTLAGYMRGVVSRARREKDRRNIRLSQWIAIARESRSFILRPVEDSREEVGIQPVKREWDSGRKTKEKKDDKEGQRRGTCPASTEGKVCRPP